MSLHGELEFVAFFFQNTTLQIAHQCKKVLMLVNSLNGQFTMGICMEQGELFK